MLKKRIKKYDLDVFKEIAQGLSTKESKDIWEEKPVDIEEFIDSKHYLNQKWNGKNGCRPVIKEIAKEIAKDNVREAVLLLGKGCLSGNTIIWTKDGPKKMYELNGKQFQVQSKDVKTLKPFWNNAMCVSRGRKLTKRYIFDNGMFLDATDNHNVDVVGIGVIPFSEMKIGQYISAPRKLLRPNENEINNPYLYRLTGLLIGDGTILDYRIGITNCEKLVQETFIDCVKKIDPLAKISHHINHIDIYLWETYEGQKFGPCGGTRQYLYDVYENLGLLNCRVHDKHIPEKMMNGSYENICELLSGLFSTDGWFEFRERLPKAFYTSCSRKLLEQIKLLLLRLGIVANLKWRRKRVKLETWKKARHNWYGCVEISGFEDLYKLFDNLDITRPNTKFMENIVRNYNGLSMKPLDQIPLEISIKSGMKSKGKTGVARYRFAKEAKNNLEALNIHWIKLVSVEENDEEEVFDIICEHPNHNYCANGIYPENSGKDFCSAILHLYGIYRSLCLYAPQSYYGLSPGSPIYFVNTARNDEQAKRVFFAQFKGLLENCPWFENKYREPGTSQVYFDKNITAISANSQAYSWLGYNVLQWVGDEIAFFLANDNDDESESRAEECWEAAFGSCQTRFNKFYKMIGITTPRFDDDFVMRKFRELQDRPDGYIKQLATWEVNPNLSKADFKHAFARDYRRAMRDFGAQPSGVIESFWADPNFIDEHPCEECRLCPIWERREIISSDYCCRDYDKCLANPYRGNGEWDDKLLKVDPEAEYFMHIDLSKNKDVLGFALGHIVDWVQVELDGYQIKELSGKDKALYKAKEDRGEKTDDIVNQERFTEKPLIKIDAIGWLNPRGERDPDMMKKREIYYTAIENRIIRYLIERGFNISKISFDQFQCIDGLTYVETSRGLLRAKDVREGDLVPTRIGPRKIIKRFEYEVEKTYKIYTNSGNYFECTGNHRIEVLKQWKQIKYGESRTYFWEWKKVNEIEPYEVIRMSDSNFSNQVDVENYRRLKIPQKKFNSRTFSGRFKDVEWPIFMEEDFAELLGEIWGDGDMSQVENIKNKTSHERIDISTCGDEEQTDVVVRLFKSVFNIDARVCYDRRNNKMRGVTVTSKIIYDFLVENRLIKKTYDNKKSIPKIILKSSKTVVAAFLRGLFDADGHVDKNDGACGLSTSSYKLAIQVKYTLQMKFGIKSTIIKRRMDGDKSCFGSYNTVYVVKTTGKRKLFFDQIGFSIKRKKDLLQKHIEREGRIICEKITKIKIINKKKKVYDFDVEEDHCYIANGFVSHNSHYLKQRIEDWGIETDLISLDRNDEIPSQAKTAFVENRVYYPWDRMFAGEAKHLKYIKGKKVDHARGFDKACCDAIFGTVYNCEVNGNQGSFEDLEEEN